MPSFIGLKDKKDENDEVSSCSEAELEDNGDKEEGGENADGTDKEEVMSPYYCQHCFTSNSKNWHHCCKERLLLCVDCR